MRTGTADFARMMNTDSLRILHVIPHYLPALRYGGPVYAVHALCKHLVLQGNQVDVFTTNVDGRNSLDVEIGQSIPMDGVGVHYFPAQFPRRLFYSPLLSRALAASIQKYDLLHLHTIYLHPTLAAARIAYENKIPYLVSPHGMLVKDLIRRKNTLLKKAWISLFERCTLEHATAVQVTSRLEATEAKKFNFDWPEIFELPLGLETPVPQPAVTRDSNLILFLGRINWKKGLDRLIPALARLPERKLLIAGNDETGYTRELKKLAEQYSVSNQIVFYGPVRGKAKWQLYQQAQLFVLPSYSENFAITVLEAMAMSCPVVVTPEVGLAKTVADFGAGLVCDGDPLSLQAAIQQILEHPESARRMGKVGQRVVADHFSWINITSSLASTYRRMLECRQV